MLILASINWLAVVVATIAAFIVGFVWFSPALFGKDWMSSVPSAKGGKMKMKPSSFFIALVASFLVALVLEFFIKAVGTMSLSVGLEIAGFVWAGFFLSKELVGMAFGRPMKMFTIQVAHDLIALVVIAVILVLMG